MESPDETPSKAAASKGRWKRRMAALILGLGVPFLVGELAVRATLGSPLIERLPIVEVRANPERGWEMVPGTTHYTYEHAVNVNSLGLRGAEIEPKQAGERRILALGDSLIYGQGVAEEDTVPVLLEKALQASSKGAGKPPGDASRWSVVNAGHRAYDSHQELGLLRELGQTIDPDIILLFWYWNDMNERDIGGTFERLTESGPIYFDTGDNLEGLDRWRWHGKQWARRSALVMAAYDMVAKKTPEPEDPDYIEAAFKRLDVYLNEFVTRSQDLGATLYLAPIPDSGTLLGEHPSKVLLERAAALAQSKGIPVIDLLPALGNLARERGSLPILPFDGHYLPEGNQAIAAAVAAALGS